MKLSTIILLKKVFHLVHTHDYQAISPSTVSHLRLLSATFYEVSKF